ncbi:U3 small nucleolar RNA-associated protein MPP10 [Cryptococcus neoformans var. grubii Br795]|uniref:U3 small nucleolar ribonucleoprotein protein MPP10 n=1 Tax=Cryptococcus neoformans Tu259-1 TaxID=1230072 RepID=A0A854QHM0_CRYNE|nr:U3 small nucleolar RNA-associated protein MPP10 [Cryptococcus neoformans var. grubii AD1-83a]OXG26108.1 U3 small nucleolar RNA-associated protein MPP10 [Cryptococcus neoformans var. grubii Tu259-1]OXG53006.1 U3 small nucleolar RNA-associated protein MPP10 [Cryptococcus neoformans var. grubii Th84]OXG65482.1 U3 small nucleolar RNA-associated protein MPP10 [Cryptococcus neoformans var. grubii MW-RSA1955]OXG67450.1 U3 small nucleolar RNA-associated protein MPP10 [Cryptococcus neoformans var. gr
MSADQQPLDQPIHQAITDLAQELEQKPWILASGGDESVAEKSLSAAKAIFDLGVSLEPISHPHLHPFLLSVLEPPSINLRSRSKSEQDEPETQGAPTPESTLPYTPLSVLTIDGFDPEQVWAQLELRAQGVVNAVKSIDDSNGDAEEDFEGNPGSDDSDEDMTLEEFREMLKEAGYDNIDSMSEEELIEMRNEMEGGEDAMSLEEFREMLKESGEDVDDMTEEELMERMDEFEGDESDDSEESDIGSDEDEDDEVDDDDGEGDEEDELLASTSEAEDDEELSIGNDDGDEEEEEVQVEDQGDSEDDDTSTLFGSAAGPSKPRKGHHPTLDDDFFSIDEFNRLTEEAEAGRLTSGRLGGDEDDEEELGDVGALMLDGAGDDEEIGYADFFEPPRGAKLTKGKSNGKEKKGKGKSRSKVRFDDDEVMDEDEEMAGEEEEDEDEARGIMGRVKGDLFDSEDEEDQEDQVLSTHEKRQKALAEEIAQLESEAVGPKEWTLLGEASSRTRPQNSLLEEDLDFEHVAKVVPVITEDSVATMEELIKQRILDNNFDSPVRVRAFEPTPFLPSRFFELQDTQSSKSLAQIYEEEYQAAASGEKLKDARDQKLQKAHEEIEGLWSEICYKLDALSSLNFVPKAPKASITTISDLPTTSMESALPPTAAASTMLAPQDLFAAPSSTDLVARSELTSEEAQKLRNKHRKHKKAERKKLGEMEELYGKKRKSVREEKEEALKGLVKSGKGVTVVGKGAKEMEKGKKRGTEGGEQDGKRLKL